MKVLMTADAVGGVWTYAQELCRALGSRDCEVILAVMGPAPSAKQREAVRRLTHVRLLHGRWKLEWMNQPWADVERAGDWLLEIAERERVDVVHLNGYAHAALHWRRPTMVVAHSCVCSWWHAVHGERAPAEWDRYRRAVADGLSAADIVVSPTHAFLDSLRALHGFNSESTVIHNALAPPPSSVDGQREPMIFACGRAWDEAKNVRVLDEAALGLSWETYIAGERVSPDGRSCDLRFVHGLGAIAPHKVHAWMSRAAIFAHTALYEPFGLAVLEAAQRGCALVLSDIPTLRELWQDAALFADASDADAFRLHLQWLIDHPTQRSAFARAARVRAESFQLESMANAYQRLYRELASIRQSQELAVA
jgi:glycosyltransferase involved in cell wall biosynthesis